MNFASFDAVKKQRLLDAGRWGDFVLMRDAKRASGLTMAKANHSVWREIAVEEGWEHPDGRPVLDDAVQEAVDAAVAAGAPRRGKPGRPTREEMSSRRAEEQKRITEAAKAMAETMLAGPKTLYAGGGVEGAAAAKDGTIVDMSVFAGRRCSRSKAIEWAYVNASVESASPEEAPSALAWCLMIDFRRSVSYRFELFKAVAVKAVAKEEAVVDDGSGGIDGQEEYDILARLGGAHVPAAASASASVSAPEVSEGAP